MTYSCTDFADAIQDKLQEVGALHQTDKRVETSDGDSADFDPVEAYKEDPGAQATACLTAIDRFVEVRDAAIARRDALIALDTRNETVPRDHQVGGSVRCRRETARCCAGRRQAASLTPGQPAFSSPSTHVEGLLFIRAAQAYHARRPA